MSERITFVDTNVLVAESSGVVSTQVLAELSSVLRRKVGLAPAAARRVFVVYTAWPIVQIDAPMLAAAMLRNQQDDGSWWDCLIVEAALRAGAARLASEDFEVGHAFDSVLDVVDPLAA